MVDGGFNQKGCKTALILIAQSWNDCPFFFWFIPWSTKKYQNDFLWFNFHLISRNQILVFIQTFLVTQYYFKKIFAVVIYINHNIMIDWKKSPKISNRSDWVLQVQLLHVEIYYTRKRKLKTNSVFHYIYQIINIYHCWMHNEIFAW